MHRHNHQGKVPSETKTLVGCGQLCLLFSKIAGYFDHQCLRKESVYILLFLHGDIHQGKVTSEATTFAYILPGVPRDQSYCRIL